MNRVMGDSTTIGAIPLTVNIVGFYINGLYAAPMADLEARFPHARYGHCSIDVLGTAPQASARDWETGDKAGSLEQWCIDHNKASGKKDATIYCNRSTIAEVRQLTGSQILNVDYFLWIATLDNSLFTPQDLPGVIACQDKGATQNKANFDTSVVWDSSIWLPLAPPPVPAPTRAQAQGALDLLQRFVG